MSIDLLSITMKKTSGEKKGGKPRNKTKNLNKQLHGHRLSLKKYSCSETFLKRIQKGLYNSITFASVCQHHSLHGFHGNPLQTYECACCVRRRTENPLWQLWRAMASANLPVE